MNKNLIRSSLKRQFNRVLKREYITIQDYYDNTVTYDVFFRRNGRGTSPQGKLRFYYPQDTDIRIGTVFTLKGEDYLVISKDGIESDVYYSSLAIKCNVHINTYSNIDGQYKTIPYILVADKYTSTATDGLTEITGTVSIYTGDNKYLREVIDESINIGCYAFGNYYKINNSFFNNGFGYIYLVQDKMPQQKMEFYCSNETDIDLANGDTVQLIYNAFRNGIKKTPDSITYSSSDESIATIDQNGLMTLYGKGTVTINASWYYEANSEDELDGSISSSERVDNSTTFTITDTTISSQYFRIRGQNEISAWAYNGIHPFKAKYVKKIGNEYVDVTDEHTTSFVFKNYPSGNKINGEKIEFDYSITNQVSIKLLTSGYDTDYISITAIDDNGEFGSVSYLIKMVRGKYNASTVAFLDNVDIHPELYPQYPTYDDANEYDAVIGNENNNKENADENNNMW